MSRYVGPLSIPASPNTLSIEPNLTRGLPMMATASRGSTYGVGIGYGWEALQIAIYEYLERSAFLTAYGSAGSGPIHEVGDVGLTAAIQRALSQTCESQVRGHESTHSFRMVSALLLNSSKPVRVPEVFVSLRYEECDRVFLPFSDSSGSCLHVSPTLVLQGALYEFIERQCLIRAWLLDTGLQAILIDNDQVYLSKETRSIRALLSMAGTVHCLNITVPGFGHAVLSLFVSRIGRRTFCCGAAAHGVARIALEKSIKELWQGFCYMRARDDVAKDVQAATQLEMKNRSAKSISASEQLLAKVTKTIDINSFILQDDLAVSRILEHIHNVSSNTVFYMDSTHVNGSLYFFGKLFNPDYYIHINMERPNNFHNVFSRTHSIENASGIGTAFPFG